MRQPPLPSTIRLPGFSPATGANSSSPESGALSHSRAGFASESRQERTYVRDWRIERRKARPGKARTLREQKKRKQVYCSAATRRTISPKMDPNNIIVPRQTCFLAYNIYRWSAKIKCGNKKIPHFSGGFFP